MIFSIPNFNLYVVSTFYFSQVHYKFELMDETLFLTVNLIDRFLARQMVGRKKLQLVGVTALLLACKYEEVSVPFMEDLVLISDRAYTRDEILTMVMVLMKHTNKKKDWELAIDNCIHGGHSFDDLKFQTVNSLILPVLPSQ